MPDFTTRSIRRVVNRYFPFSAVVLKHRERQRGCARRHSGPLQQSVSTYPLFPLRTIAMTIMALLLTSTIAMSTYPFDPRQALSAVLIALFVIVGAVIVKVYADMHRDATLSHVTNTKPGEMGTEFWFKIVGFGFASLVGLLTRVFPGITDFIFSWLQPGVSSLK